MNNNEYILSNLNVISRIALLENAQESRAYIDALILILRYMDNKEPMSTVVKELNVIEQMFRLFSRRKRDAFHGIILSKDLTETCYIKKGSIINLVQISLSKKVKINQDQLEIKVITKSLENHVEIVIQDNGQVDYNTEEESLYDIYTKLKAELEEQPMDVTYKKGIGTKVIITV